MGIDGLPVLDVAEMPAIYATKLLADLGADVIRLEPPAGDPLREVGPFVGDVPGPGRSLPFAFYNTNKRSIVTGDPAEIRRLIGWARVVVGDPGVDVAAINPAAIWARVTPFGRSGPKRDWRATDLVAMAAGGVLGMNGFPGRRPIHAPLNQAYHLGGAALASGILLAVRQGGGQLVDVSLQAAVATATENAIGYWDLEGFIRPQLGDRAFNGTTVLYRCRDGWVAGMAGNRWDEMIAWAAEAGVLTDEWHDPALVDRDARAGRMETANRLIVSLFASQPVAEVARRAEAIRIPIQPVNRIDDLFRDRQLIERGFWTALAHDDLGRTITYPGAPFLSTSGFWRLRRRAPLPGEGLGHIPVFVGRASLPDSSARERDSTPLSISRRDESGRDARPTKTGTRPLAGMRVLDFSQAVTGPLVGRILGDYGAEVIKVEWATRPDPQRFFPPRNGEGPNVSALFNLVNGSKKSLTLNLNLADGRAVLHRLVAISDILLDNYGADPFPKWGIDYPAARAINPAIILARSSTAGRSGPRSGLAGLGYGISAAAGWNLLMGEPGDPPVGMGPAYPDYSVNCHHLLVAILVALAHRDATGQGQYLDLSQHESTIGWIGPQILDYTVNGRVAGPAGNRHPAYAPHGVYPAGDGWIAIAVAPDDWDRFRAISGLDDRYAGHADRKTHENDLDALVAAWTMPRDRHALAERLQAAGIAASAVATAEDLLADPQLTDHFVRIDHPEAGARVWDRGAFRLSTADGTPSRSPLLGEHTDWVLDDLIGLAPDHLADLYVAGAVG